MPDSTTVILGAGIIGASTAYYLSQSLPGQSIHLVESSPELFASASGKAGGFLASDWFGPSSAPLGALSFDLHKQLAETHNGPEQWGYSRSTGASFSESAGKITSNKRSKDGDWLREGNSRAEMAGEHEFVEGDGPAWLTRRDGDNFDVISEDETVAQVDPLRLSQFLLEQCLKRGVQLHQPAEATSTITDGHRIVGLKLNKGDGSEIQISCTTILFACGAWTPKVYKTLFPSSKLRIPVAPYAGHSIVIKSPRWSSQHEKQGCHAIFSTSSSGFSPELISRIGGEIYIAGLNSDSIPLPNLATETKIDNSAIDELKETAQRLCGLEDSNKGDLEVVRQGLCFRPVTPRGQPILARIPDGKLGGLGTAGGVFVAAGHGPWGISLALGTGLVMSELIRGQKTSCKISGLGMQ